MGMRFFGSRFFESQWFGAGARRAGMMPEGMVGGTRCTVWPDVSSLAAIDNTTGLARKDVVGVPTLA